MRNTVCGKSVVDFVRYFVPRGGTVNRINATEHGTGDQEGSNEKDKALNQNDLTNSAYGRERSI